MKYMEQHKIIKGLLKERNLYLKDKSVAIRELTSSEVAVWNMDHFMFWLRDKYRLAQKE